MKKKEIQPIEKNFGTFAKFERQCSINIERFLKEINRAALNQYRQEVGNPPGSSRTKRLRKKRQKAVLSWFLNQSKDLKRS